MQPFKTQLYELFTELNIWIEEISQQRRSQGLFGVSMAKVQLLGQISLLVQDRVSMILSLAQTGDLDDFLTMDEPIKAKLKIILGERGLIYDEDSYLIWIPPNSKFKNLFQFENLIVEAIDPESALVSKAIKAPEKNKQLIREAIASHEFPMLINRILENGGKLENFI